MFFSTAFIFLLEDAERSWRGRTPNHVLGGLVTTDGRWG